MVASSKGKEFFMDMLLLLAITLCLGGWINTLKMAKGSRFEVYYMDFILGVFFSVLALALFIHFFTIASPFTIYQIEKGGYIFVTRAFLAGILLNFAGILLVASSSFNGIGCSFLAVHGAALIVDGGIYFYLSSYTASLLYLLSSCLIASAIYGICFLQKKNRRAVAQKTMFLSCIAGICLALFYPLFDRSLEGSAIPGLPPYTAAMILAIGMIVCQLFLAPLSFKNPIFGHPLDFSVYFNVSMRHHLLGGFGGLIWFFGLLLKHYAEGILPQGEIFFWTGLTPLLAFLFGIFFWREFPRERNPKWALASIFCSYLVGVGLMTYYRYGY